MLTLLLSTLFSGVLAAQEKAHAETKEQAHRIFLSWLDGTLEQARKGQLPKPEVEPPEPGLVFIDAAGWIRPEVLEYSRRLKPVALSTNGTTLRLTMNADKRPHEVTGHYDAAWDTRQWIAELVYQPPSWRVVNFRALVAKPASSRPLY